MTCHLIAPQVKRLDWSSGDWIEVGGGDPIKINRFKERTFVETVDGEPFLELVGEQPDEVVAIAVACFMAGRKEATEHWEPRYRLLQRRVEGMRR